VVMSRTWLRGMSSLFAVAVYVFGVGFRCFVLSAVSV